MANPLRDAVPVELAQWLDAESTHETDCGQPGFPALRAAWIGHAPTTDELLTEVAAWTDRQTLLRADADTAWAQLISAGPQLEGDALPEWHTAWWVPVLRYYPWDERLADAIAGARAATPPVA